MDRLTQLRGEAGGSRDSTLDASSPADSFMTANESSSKYYSVSEVDSSYDISPIKDVSLASVAADPEKTITGKDELISSLSPIPKKNDLLDSFKFNKEIEAANILSGGVNIFDDNDNSYDGDELVIDDNVDIDDKSNSDLKLTDSTDATFQKIDDHEPLESETIGSKDTEVVLQIDGKNVNAIDIGNGLYLYRKEGEEELAAVQIVDDDQQQPSFKFLKVRENAEGNLEVYEEIEVEVPKEVPVKDGKTAEKNALHVPIKDITKVINDSTCNKVADRKIKLPQIVTPETIISEVVAEPQKGVPFEIKTEGSFNGKMKSNETRKSPVIHSTPNKEGIPLTKTMVDLQLHPNRHSDNVKTIEVHTDSCKQRLIDTPPKNKDSPEDKVSDIAFVHHDKGELKDKNEVIEQENRETIPDKDKKTEDKKNYEKIENVVPPKDGVVIQEQMVKELTVDVDKKKHNYNKGMQKELDISENVTEQLASNASCSLQLDKNSIDSTKKVDVTQLNKNDDTAIKNIICVQEDVISKNNEVDNIDSKDKELPQNKDDKRSNEKEELVKYDHKGSEDLQKIELKKPETIRKEASENSTEHFTKNADDIPKEIGTDIKPSIELEMKQRVDTTDKRKITDDSKELETSANESLVNTDNSIKEKPIIADNTEGRDLLKIENKLSSDDKLNVKDIARKETGVKIQQSILLEDKKGELSDSTDLPVKSNLLNEKVCQSQATKSSGGLMDEVKTTKIDATPQITTKNEPKILPEHGTKSFLGDTIKPIELDSKRTINKDDVASQKDTDMRKKGGLKADKLHETIQKVTENNTELKTEVTKISTNMEQKAINNNHSAVPFGKWTEANRQDFLNKIKETKIHINSSNTKQLKQTKDLNRRDILQKIDSQRQSNNATAKAQELTSTNKLNLKNEPITFTSKHIEQKTKIPVKSDLHLLNNKPISIDKHITKQELVQKPQKEAPISTMTTNVPKKESAQRKEIHNQELIDKTIEDIINRAPLAKTNQEETKQTIKSEDIKAQKDISLCPMVYQPKDKQRTSLDAIEMKMNELHGIPFVERPPHELPQVYNQESNTNKKSNSNSKASIVKSNKIPDLVPYPNKGLQKVVKENIAEVESEEEIIEHEPITGDIELDKKNIVSNIVSKLPPSKQAVSAQLSTDAPEKKGAIITEKDFDKFARRNSITYENCLTVNFETNEPHNVIQTVIEKEVPVKKYSRNEILLAEAKVKASQKHQAQAHKHASKIHITSKLVPVNEDVYNKNYQSKLQIAYQSALTAKRRLESPITIIEDKPVKVVFMDSNTEFAPTQLNVLGHDLSPAKKQTLEPDSITVSTCDSLDSDVLDAIDDVKLHDDLKVKTKHQRKQVLTPVEAPELELIEPVDLGIALSPKKKRRTDDNKIEKTSKVVVPKKSYLLGRTAVIEEKAPLAQDLSKNPLKETIHQNSSVVSHQDAASAIDNLVKAAELLETQSENFNTSTVSSDNSQQNTPVKRGRGRPRKYPLPEGSPSDENKVSTPQKKPRLIDAKKPKRDSDTDDDICDEERVVKENWTMGKINENIVCPICNKLFRSESVVFKHVKHCPGPSPIRSDSDKRSSSRSRESRESDRKLRDSKSEDKDYDSKHMNPRKDKKRKSKDYVSESSTDKDDVIVIEDTPIKSKRDEPKPHVSRKTATEEKVQPKVNQLTCELCGKIFRQLSYLVSHKMQHKKEEPKKNDEKSVLSCEVCKKDFRKLHHLVQHRLIHTQSNSNLPTRSQRKSSSEQTDSKNEKEQPPKQTEDPTAAFRCEPCDKSFRKLHHLVEHRESHGSNKTRKSSSTQPADKSVSGLLPQCDLCNKTFKRVYLLMEHKEQHLESCSEKSDDKSVKSALSTKDIIHECSLCYMVFPNEHSLNKHSVICQKKKRQSAAKPNKEENIAETNNEVSKPKELNLDEPKPVEGKEETVENTTQSGDNSELPVTEEIEKGVKNDEIPVSMAKDIKTVESKVLSSKRDIEEVDNSADNVVENTSAVPSKIKKVEESSDDEAVIKILDTPKKKTLVKEKVNPTITKRLKSSDIPLSMIKEGTAIADSSDEDEVRYMLNPDFKGDETSEGKLFMKVRAKKRNSLQIERPNSKDLVLRRTSLQHPPKIARLKPKLVETKIVSSNSSLRSVSKTTEVASAASTDSEYDSDVKYSFPKNIAEKSVKPKAIEKTPKEKRKTLTEKRKPLSGIAKRKSLGKPALVKPKEKALPIKPIKRRTAEIEHRCDCGQLFSSAALLSRHTTLAHTPPRIRRKRSPPVEITKPTIKPAPRKSSASEKPKPTDSRKSIIKSNASMSNANPKTVATRKSSTKSETKTTPTRKSMKSAEKSESDKTSVVTRRNIAHRGVPVTEKMRKLAEKSKK